MSNKIETSIAIPMEEWGKFFDGFSQENRGRMISIEIIDSEHGDQELMRNGPFMAMIYDRPNKGNNLMIEVGKEEMTYAHTIDSPTEVMIAQDASGIVMAVEITDASGIKTLVTLQVN